MSSASTDSEYVPEKAKPKKSVKSQKTVKTEKTEKAEKYAKKEPELAVIRAVKRVPALWNQNLKSYKDSTSKALYWAEAAKECEIGKLISLISLMCEIIDVEECQKVWHRLRNGFSKNRKRKQTGSGLEESQSTYLYGSEMEFIAPFVDPRPRQVPPGTP